MDSGRWGKIGLGPSMYEMEGPSLALRIRRADRSAAMSAQPATDAEHPPEALVSRLPGRPRGLPQ